ncbi:sigma 54-interacting transcriptional regulator [candidate division WOR-3 bacterium]|nr:sigma 54-interacting transcriptional regulator [candidate division WOR-3 bacterium]
MCDRKTKGGEVPRAPYTFSSIVGLDTYKLRALHLAQKEVNVLIVGESGTGKELFASSIHNASVRARKPFVIMNCAAIPESLFESELFGYRKGAFTDARQDHTGRIEFASGGTLFLDEIGDLPLPVQSKLLRVIEDKSVTRLGGNAHQHVDVRYVFATNQDLGALVSARKFREELYYRISAPCLKIPPLRKRKEEIPALVEQYLEHCHYDHGLHITLTKGALSKLMKYHFPGNVRELHGIVKNAVFICNSGVISEAEVDIQHHCSAKNLKEQLEEHAIRIIREQLTVNNHNVKMTAQQLDISPRTLYRYLKK